MDGCGRLVAGAAAIVAAALLTGAPAGALAAAPHAHGAAGETRGIDPAWAEAKHRDILALHALLDRQPAEVVAVSGGIWSDPTVWSTEEPPGPGSSVRIPPGVRVALAGRIAGDGPRLIRVDGTLALSPDITTRLAAGTIVVTDGGRLEVGTAARPIRPEVEAEIVFTDRGGRDVGVDPFDIGGGLLATGQLDLHGAPKDGVAMPADELRRGMMLLRFGRAPAGWRIGDRLLVPGTDERRDQDEVVRIASIAEDGRAIGLDRQLAHDRRSPRPHLVPVGNLSRNVVLRSDLARPDARRGHVMVVHRAGGTLIDSVRFEGLGRTRTEAVATRPTLTSGGDLVPGSDANTLGRYMLHFHNQIGASLAESPHRVARSVFEGGPRHGLVNHGDHVVAEDNVSFRIAGAHFFGENGAEIGSFTGNLAVRSRGSGDGATPRRYAYDFAHGGHGFWMQGGGIELSDNYAFGHASSAFVVFTMSIPEAGLTTWFDRQNLRPGLLPLKSWNRRIKISQIPFVAHNNIAAASYHGFEIWKHGTSALRPVYSEVTDSVFWAMRRSPILMRYAGQIEFRNVALFGGEPTDDIGVALSASGSFRFVDMEIRGFQIGIVAPAEGSNDISGGLFANDRDIVVTSPLEWGRRIAVRGTRSSSRQHVVLERRPSELVVRLLGVELGGPSNRFLDDQVLLDDRQLYFPDQLPDAVPFPGAGPTALRGLTAAQIWAEYGLAVGGALAGPDAKARADAEGLVGAPAPRPRLAEPLVDRRVASLPRVWGYRLPDGRVGRVDTHGLDDGWQVVALPGERMGLLMQVDHRAPQYTVSPDIPPSICPHDLDHGVLVTGNQVDSNGDVMVSGSLRLILTRYEVSGQTAVFPFEVRDNAGNVSVGEIAFGIDDDAPCRGSDVGHYLHARSRSH